MKYRGEMLNKMLVLVTNAHANQYDRGGKPYVLHVLAVMNILNSSDEELQCIALGHDVIEDTKTTYQDLKDLGFTERVIDGIRRLTKQPGQTLDEYKALIFQSEDAMLVKAADLTHNSDIRRLKGISEKDIERMAKYHQFYIEIQRHLAEVNAK